MRRHHAAAGRPLPSDQLKIASWNVNSIKVRGEQVIAWLQSSNTDILMMQETKSMDENFPVGLFKDAGYDVHIHGQKTYNGVAIASRIDVDDVRPRLPHPESEAMDEQARYLEIDVAGITMAGLYLPNGNPVRDDSGDLAAKFTYKLEWMKRLADRAEDLDATGRPVLLGGDFNIIPYSNDAWDIDVWKDDALHHPESLAAYRTICWKGYTELFRAHHPHAIAYTFWDYQSGAWQKDHGVRIDHFLANAEATDLVRDVGIDKTPRGNDRASDHTPIWCVMDRP
jgi:exodeoxyribonuclease-3